MTATAVIIDDEAPARSRLARLLRDALAGRIDIVGEAADGESGLALIEEKSPDLAFVDVQMPGLDGIAMVTRIPAPAPYVIFTTAHAYLLFFSNRGRVYRLRAVDIPERERTAKGIPIVNLLPLQAGETDPRRFQEISSNWLA
jgi:DNA-binding LytR/AlgR family response regulator